MKWSNKPVRPVFPSTSAFTINNNTALHFSWIMSAVEAPTALRAGWLQLKLSCGSTEGLWVMTTLWDDGQSELTECYSVVSTSHNEGGENQSEGSLDLETAVFMCRWFMPSIKSSPYIFPPFRRFNRDTERKWSDRVCCHGEILDLRTHIWYTSPCRRDI